MGAFTAVGRAATVCAVLLATATVIATAQPTNGTVWPWCQCYDGDCACSPYNIRSMPAIPTATGAALCFTIGFKGCDESRQCCQDLMASLHKIGLNIDPTCIGREHILNVKVNDLRHTNRRMELFPNGAKLTLYSLKMDINTAIGSQVCIYVDASCASWDSFCGQGKCDFYVTESSGTDWCPFCTMTPYDPQTVAPPPIPDADPRAQPPPIPDADPRALPPPPPSFSSPPPPIPDADPRTRPPPPPSFSSPPPPIPDADPRTRPPPPPSFSSPPPPTPNNDPRARPPSPPNNRPTSPRPPAPGGRQPSGRPDVFVPPSPPRSPPPSPPPSPSPSPPPSSPPPIPDADPRTRPPSPLPIRNPSGRPAVFVPPSPPPSPQPPKPPSPPSPSPPRPPSPLPPSPSPSPLPPPSPQPPKPPSPPSPSPPRPPSPLPPSPSPPPPSPLPPSPSPPPPPPSPSPPTSPLPPAPPTLPKDPAKFPYHAQCPTPAASSPYSISNLYQHQTLNQTDGQTVWCVRVQTQQCRDDEATGCCSMDFNKLEMDINPMCWPRVRILYVNGNAKAKSRDSYYDGTRLVLKWTRLADDSRFQATDGDELCLLTTMQCRSLDVLCPDGQCQMAIFNSANTCCPTFMP